MKKFLILATIPLSVVGQDTGFYKDKERGWFWHETQPTEEEIEQKKDVPEQSASSAPQTVELNSQWLKENIPVLLSKAMDNPTKENLAAYAYAQRLAMDTASRFSTRMTDFMAFETQLDESKRRPNSSMGLTEFNKEREAVLTVAMDEIKLNSKGIFFFYSSTCGFCHKMIPILNEFTKRHNIEILGISLDGGVIPGMENFNIVEDMSNEVALQFNVTITPTLYLVMPNNEGALIVEGLKPLPDLEDKLLLAARKMGALQEDLFAKTRGVREISVYRNSDGSIVADKELIENDPAYLSELLKKQLDDSMTLGTPIKRAD